MAAAVLFLNHPHFIGAQEILVKQAGLMSSEDKLAIGSLFREIAYQFTNQMGVYAVVYFIYEHRLA